MTITLDAQRPMVKIAELEKWLGLERTTLRRYIQEGRFPKPAGFIGEHRVWYADEVQAWLTLELARGRTERKNATKRLPGP